MQKKKNLIKVLNIGEMRSFPKEQEVAIFQNFAKELVRQNGQQSPIFKVELQRTCNCNVRITSWIMVLIAFLTNFRRSLDFSLVSYKKKKIENIANI